MTIQEYKEEEIEIHKGFAKRWGELHFWELLNWWRLEKESREHDKKCDVFTNLKEQGE